MQVDDFLGGRVSLFRGDCIATMATLPDNSVDAIVCDPPYHLTSIVQRFGADNAAPSEQKTGSAGVFARSSSGFMGKKWDGVAVPDLDSGLGNWLAGFADGEGCFTVRKSGAGFVCEFCIHVRADDAYILRHVHSATGIGDIDGPRAREDVGSPMIKWIVRRQVDCAKLVHIFRAFPLRAKKRRDFEVWASAVEEWIIHEPGTSWSDLASHAELMSAVKKYGSSLDGSQLFHYRWARQAFRILKPGGHILAFSGTRTYHRLASAIEDAGFEIRDQAAWAYGTGFPKAHDVPKAIETHRFQEWLDRNPEQRARYAKLNAWAKRRDRRGSSKGLRGRIESAFRRAAGVRGDIIGYEVLPNDMRNGSLSSGWNGEENAAHTREITDHALDEAAEWVGWKSALKPAWEPIAVARKPLAVPDGKGGFRAATIAENILLWGVGALNIGACRIPAEKAGGWGGAAGGGGTWNESNSGLGKDGEARPVEGRYPANILHDGSAEVVSLFPNTQTPGGNVPKRSAKSDAIYGEYSGAGSFDAYGDSGSAARFFFSAKADADDRMTSGHPTVKPRDLMRWLVRLVTPRGGTVLDPFAGTGPTGEAAFWEGCNAILCEREPEYCEDIARRMKHVLSGPDERKRARTTPAPAAELPLFSA